MVPALTICEHLSLHAHALWGDALADPGNALGEDKGTGVSVVLSK